ncbi:MAG: Ig-like domain-containing protein [Pseudomonadota bacterium]
MSHIGRVICLLGLTVLSACDDSVQPLVDAVEQRENGVLSIAFDTHPTRLPVGAGTRLSLLATGFDGVQSPYTGPVEWRSSDSAVASVTSGFVGGVSVGSATVTATVGAAVASTALSTYAGTLTGIGVVPDPVAIDECRTGAATVSGNYADGNTFVLLPPHSVTAPSNLVISDSTDGLTLYARESGSYSVPITRNTLANTFGVVAADTLSSIQLNSNTVSLATGGTYQFEATGTYSSGGTADITALGTWAITQATPSTAITLSSSPLGQVNAVATGSGTVRFSCGGLTSDATVLVDSSAVIQRIEIGTGAGEIDLASGASDSLVLTAHFADGSSATVTEQASWSVPLGDTLAVSVNDTAGNKGVVTAATGITTATSAIVRAEYSGFTTIVRVFVGRI